MYDLTVHGPLAEPPLWNMKMTVLDEKGAECAPAGVFVRWHAEGAGPDFPPIVVPCGQKNEGGHIWSEFGPLEGVTTVYTAQLVDAAGEALSGIAACDNKLQPVDWPTLVEKHSYTWEAAQDVTGGQVHARFDISARLVVVPPVPAWFLISAEHAEELRQHLATALYILDTCLNTTTCIPADFQ